MQGDRRDATSQSRAGEHPPGADGPVQVQIAAGQLWRVAAVGSAIFTLLGVVVPIVYYVIKPKAIVWYELLPMFDLSADDTLQTWWASGTLLLCAALAAAIARGAGPLRRYWLFGSVVLVAMSADEVARAHERVGELVEEQFGELSGPFYYAWVVVALPLLAIVAILLLRLVLALARPSRTRFLVAVATYLAGGLGIEMGNAAYDSPQGPANQLVYALSTVVEETVEMVGVVLLLRALLLQLSALRVEVTSDA